MPGWLTKRANFPSERVVWGGGRSTGPPSERGLLAERADRDVNVEPASKAAPMSKKTANEIGLLTIFSLARM